MKKLEIITDEQEGISRRKMLELLGASLALAGGACTRQPLETIVPRARRPEETIPGKPRWFATSMPLAGGSIGLLVESHEGRPTKVEGNPDHPASLGSSDVFAQAALLDLYSPSRAKAITKTGRVASWDALVKAIQPALEKAALTKGRGLRVLSETITSPTLARQRAALLSRYPEARWHQWSPIHRDAERKGAMLAFGRDVSTVVDLSQAEVIVSLGSHLLDDGPGFIRHAREYGARKKTGGVRLYALESAPTLTGGAADHRLVLSPTGMEEAAFAILSGQSDERFLKAVIEDLEAHRGKSAVVVGRYQPPELHALAHAINAKHGNIASTVRWIDPVDPVPEDHVESISSLVESMQKGEVELLVMLGGNPAYDAPSDLGFEKALDRVALRIHLGRAEDETSQRSHWHIPETHFLESWSDAVAYDGTHSIVQPLIAPLYQSKSVHEVTAMLLGVWNASAHELVRESWKHFSEERWRTALHDGVASGPSGRIELWPEEVPPSKREASLLSIAFRPDPTIWDGRYSDNGWLQELPKPLTHLTWDNAMWVAPRDADRLKLEFGDVVEIAVGDQKVEAPIWIVPAVAPGVLVMHLGYGRRIAGPIGRGKGYDAYPLRNSSTQWNAPSASMRKTGERYPLVTTQEHALQEGRQLARAVPVSDLGHLHHEAHPHATLAHHHTYPDHAWGMVIDVGSCIGCNACTIACQAENNIPIVGKEQVAMGREMHWIRVDRYYEGGIDNPEARHQPVPCMHCENAPCETVCPVGATVHSSEGLNDMVYNRCVGTRYCANNCPYKVRRFNFFLYQVWEEETLKLQRNPDVTVRSRGVMEKCTYCIQRINEARFEKRRQGEGIEDGDIVTACEQACPTRAITFGDLNDPESRVAKLRKEPHHYGLLEELNTVPRTTYLAKITNPKGGLG